MPITSNERSALRDQVELLLKRHIEHPFETLRERGAVAQLFAGLRGTEQFDTFVEAELTLHRASARTAPPSRTVKVGCVQAEVTVRGQIDQLAVEKAVDLVAFNKKPAIFYGGHGHGDVLQQTTVSSIGAAIEIKASPSGDPAAGGEYAKDIFALLWLAGHGVSAFFVLLDKSSPRFRAANVSAPTKPVSDWMTDGFRLRDRGKNREPSDPTFADTSLGALGILLAADPPDVPYVEVWWIAHQQNGLFAPRHCFAYLGGKSENIHVERARANAAAQRKRKEEKGVGK